VNEEAPGTGLLCEQSAVRTLNLDDVHLTYAVDGATGLIPRVFFPDLPAGYWADHPEALTRHGQVAMSVGGLLVERGGRRLLIDAGLGTRAGHTSLGTMNSGALPDTLAALGCDPAAIDTVAFTHLHVDHTGWAFTRNRDGTYRKTFPAARYLVAGAEWAPYGRGESLTSAAPPAVLEQLAATRTLIDDGEEIFPGVRALVTPGHSPGHTSYIITSATGRRLIALGDAFHTPAQLGHPEWPSMPDIDGTAALAARRKLIHELQQPGTLGFACHFGDQAFGRLTRTPAGNNDWEPVPATAIMPPPRQLDVAGDLPSRLGHGRADEMADTAGSRGLGLEDLGDRPAHGDPGRDDGEGGHHDECPDQRGGEPERRWHAAALNNGLVEANAERDANDDAGKRGEHLRDDESGAHLSLPGAERPHQRRGAPRVEHGRPGREQCVQHGQGDEHDRDHRQSADARL